MKKITTILCFIFVAVMLIALPVSAATPYYTYTYSISGQALRSPNTYDPYKEINADYMGIRNIDELKKLYPDKSEGDLKKMADLPMNGLTDLESDEDENVYIVDRDNSRVIVLDKYYKVSFIIDNFRNHSGNIDALKAPEGVFITKDKQGDDGVIEGRIFVCDTGNSRILTFDKKGNFLTEIGVPQSDLLGTITDYKPIAVAVDRYDRLYVVDRMCTNGIIVMTDTGEFTGYIGAQKVSISLWDRIWRRFQTEEQREKDTALIPVSFSNIALAGDFIYVTVKLDEAGLSTVGSDISSKNKSGDNAPVKMLNAAGSELMRRNGFYPPSGEVDFASAITATGDVITGPSEIVDVAVGPENTWSIIDQKRSKVFTYDFDGNLLFAFGDGKGDLLGNIKIPYLKAITYQGTSILLLDGSDKGSFTVFNRTDYGDVLLQAIEHQNQRKYSEAIEDWTKVLQSNSNFDAAYIGIGNALTRSYDYAGAIEQYKNAYDVTNYSIAFNELRQQWIAQYLWILPIIIVVLCVGFYFFAKFVGRVNKETAVSGKKRTYVQELVYVFHLIVHPFDGFWDLKHEKRGSVRAGTTILGIGILVFYYQSVGAGYVSNPQMNYLSFFEALTSVVVPVALWIIGNWCLTTLFDGEGSLKDIYIATTYSLMPAIILIIPSTLLSNVAVESELKLVSFIATLGFIWLGLLVFIGTMVTHDYSIGKNVITVVGTILAMIFIIFLAILFTTLLGKLVGFISNIITELQFRFM